MRVDPKTSPEQRSAPDSPRRPYLGPPTDDSHFRDSIATFSRELGERARQKAAVDPKVAATNRKAALHASLRARRRRFVMLAGWSGVAAVAAIVAVVLTLTPFGPTTPLATTTASSSPTLPSTVAAVPPASAAQAPPDPVPPPAPAPAVAPPANPAANPNTFAAIVEAAPGQTVTTVSLDSPTPTAPPYVEPLTRREIAEVQARLQRFGFNAGPADGNAGPMTRGAAMRYQQERGLAQTGGIDRSLLDQLRRDPATTIAPSAHRTQVAQALGSYPQQQRGGSDALAGIRAAGDNLSRFLYSIAH